MLILAILMYLHFLVSDKKKRLFQHTISFHVPYIPPRIHLVFAHTTVPLFKVYVIVCHVYSGVSRYLVE